jgi:hypothetical protein
MNFWSNSDVPPAGIYVPEKRLLAAVLHRAYADLLSGDGEIQQGALSWILEEDPSEDYLTFSFICEALDIDSESVKKKILSRKREKICEEMAFASNLM